MDDDAVNVLIGGYRRRTPPRRGTRRSYRAAASWRGMALVAKSLEGELSVVQTDHMARRGATGLGGAGFAIGLAAPPLLATTAIGAALGGGVGKLVHHKAADKIAEQAGETIPLGGARRSSPIRTRKPRRSSRLSPVPCRRLSVRPRGVALRP